MEMKQIIIDLLSSTTDKNPVATILFMYFMLTFLPVLVLYFVRKGRIGREKASTSLDKYEQAYEKYLNSKERYRDILIYHMPAFVVALIGAVLILIGAINENGDAVFNIGFAFIVAVLCYYAFRFLYEGGYATFLIASKDLHIDYKKPEYVTENVYQKWDDEPDSSARLVSSATYDKNAGKNVIVFLIKIVYIIAKILLLLEFAVVYSLDKLFNTVYSTFTCVLFKPFLRARAKAYYRDFVMEVADEGGYIYRKLYVDDAYNVIPGEIAEELKKDTEKSLMTCDERILVFVDTGDEQYFTARTVSREGIFEAEGGKMYIYENHDGRIYIISNKVEGAPDKLVGAAIPFFPSDELIEDADMVGRFANYKSLQYGYLSAAKKKYQGSKRVSIFDYSEKLDRIVTICVKLDDVELVDDETDYTISKFEIAKKTHKERSYYDMTPVEKAIYIPCSIVWMLMYLVPILVSLFGLKSEFLINLFVPMYHLFEKVPLLVFLLPVLTVVLLICHQRIQNRRRNYIGRTRWLVSFCTFPLVIVLSVLYSFVHIFSFAGFIGVSASALPLWVVHIAEWIASFSNNSKYFFYLFLAVLCIWALPNVENKKRQL